MAAALLLLARPLVAAPLTTAGFVQDMLERYRRSYPEAKIEQAGELSARIGFGSEDLFTMNFDRIFAFCQTAEPKDCEGQMQTFVEATRDIGTAQEITRERLRLAVRGSDYLSEIASSFTGEGRPAPIQRPLAQGMGLLLMADFPRTAKTVNAEDLQKLELSEENAVVLATQQVLAHLPEVPNAHELKSGALLPLEGDYVESLLLKSSDWDRLNRETRGRLFVSVPGANLLLVGLGSDQDIVGAGDIVGQIYSESPRPISPLAYRWRDGKWQPARKGKPSISE